MQKELQEKSGQVKELNKTKAEVEKLKREKEEMREQVSLEKEKEFSEKIKNEKQKIRKQVDEENEMKFQEFEKQLADQKKLIEEMKRKAEQGSMQLQGEVQELAIEEWLKTNFPFDTIIEVKKGARGADCRHIINSRAKIAVRFIMKVREQRILEKAGLKSLRMIFVNMVQTLEYLLLMLCHQAWKEWD